MAKLRKLPKRPKASASLQTWKNWEAKCKEVQKYNRKVEADKKAKSKIIDKSRSIGRL